MKRKRHKIIVTITHDKPVTRSQAVDMFCREFCMPRSPSIYYPDCFSGDVEVGEAWVVAAKYYPKRPK